MGGWSEKSGAVKLLAVSCAALLLGFGLCGMMSQVGGSTGETFGYGGLILIGLSAFGIVVALLWWLISAIRGN